METWLAHIYTQHQYLIYLLLVVLAYVEGPVLSMICGFLLKLGYFNFFLAYSALMAGDLIGDVFLYTMGYKYGYKFVDRFGKNFKLDRTHILKTEKVFHKHKYPILLLSKLTNGLGFAVVVLFTAGMVRIPFKRYMAVNALGQLAWSGLLISIGYFFGKLYLQINNVLWRIPLIIIFIIIFIFVVKYIRKLQKKIENSQ